MLRRWRENLWRPASWTKDGAIGFERIDRQERLAHPQATFGINACSSMRMFEHIIDLTNQDSSVTIPPFQHF